MNIINEVLQTLEVLKSLLQTFAQQQANTVPILIDAGHEYRRGDRVDVWMNSGTPRAHWDTGYYVVSGGKGGCENYLNVTKDPELRHNIVSYGVFRHTPLSDEEKKARAAIGSLATNVGASTKTSNDDPHFRPWHAGSDMPHNREQALAVLAAWSTPGVMSFGAERCKRVHECLTSATPKTLPPAVRLHGGVGWQWGDAEGWHGCYASSTEAFDAGYLVQLTNAKQST